MNRRRLPPVLALVVLVAACTAPKADPAASASTGTTVASPPPAPVSPTSTSTSRPAIEDPALADVDGLVRLTGNLEAAAKERNLYDPEGSYIGPVDPDGEILLLEPITGYADFSDWTIQDRWDADLQLVDDLIFRCLSDLDPRFADLIETTGGFNWSAFGGQLEQVAFAAYLACQEGLHLPRLTQAEWTDAMWEEAYAYHQAWIDCIEREAGIDWGPRIDYDTWRSQNAAYDFPPGHPFTTLDTATLKHLDQACPASPPGGYAAWNPGDPVGTP